MHGLDLRSRTCNKWRPYIQGQIDNLLLSFSLCDGYALQPFADGPLVPVSLVRSSLARFKEPIWEVVGRFFQGCGGFEEYHAGTMVAPSVSEVPCRMHRFKLSCEESVGCRRSACLGC